MLLKWTMYLPEASYIDAQKVGAGETALGPQDFLSFAEQRFQFGKFGLKVGHAFFQLGQPGGFGASR